MAKQYDLAQVVVVFDGIPISGYGTDGGVTIEPDEQVWTKKTGADGEATRSRTNSDGGKITVKLANSADVNDLLSAVLVLDRATGLGLVGQMLVLDPNGTTVVEAHNCWIQGHPKNEFMKESGEREWVFDCEELVMFLGGGLTPFPIP